MIEIKWHPVRYSSNTLWGERPRDGTYNMWLDSDGDVEYGKFESGEVDRIDSVKNNIEISNVVGWISEEEMIDYVKKYQRYTNNKLKEEMVKLDFQERMRKLNEQSLLYSLGSTYAHNTYLQSMLGFPFYRE